jgi:hypothetical protein
MSVGGEPGHLFPRPTERSGYRYFFYDKHHGRGGPVAARWATDLLEEEEFGSFDQSDSFDFSDRHGNLYGIHLRTQPIREVLLLGTLGQQVAKFPESANGPHWHGYPLGPLLSNLDPPHPRERPLPRDALQKLVDAQLLTRTERTRLLKGKMI